MSLKNHEGYLLVDNRAAGLGFSEFATFTCKHCHRVAVKEPDKSFTFCRGCEHLICAPCAAEKHKTGLCRTFEQKIDEILKGV